MKEFVEYLIKNLVSKPEEVKVETENDGEFVTFKVTVSPEDMGIVIGKQGNTINSIRNLTRAKAIKDNIKMRIDLTEVYDNN